MRVSSVQLYNMPKNVSRIKKHNDIPQGVEQPSFKGFKGASVGGGLGAIWAGVLIAACAVTTPYMLPLAGKAMLLATGTGAFAGHTIEKELSDKDDKKK